MLYRMKHEAVVCVVVYQADQICDLSVFSCRGRRPFPVIVIVGRSVSSGVYVPFYSVILSAW